MLKARILSTLRFFDLQDTPLTLLEVHKFLLADLGELKLHLNSEWEIVNYNNNYDNNHNISISQVVRCLDDECKNEVEQKHGYYCLKGREKLIDQRLENYQHGIKREKLIKRFIRGARHVPFVRGIGLVGSQPLGQQKSGSDIDLLIMVEPEFMWLARMLVTSYFQLTGHRRYGRKVANRFCLNHYVAAGKELSFDRNLYTAAEYLKARPLVCAGGLRQFQEQNFKWLNLVFPQAGLVIGGHPKKSLLQALGERLLNNPFGRWLENKSKSLQYGRLNLGEFIVASHDELSFHPDNRKKELFRRFFELQKQDQGKTVELEIPVKI